ncbi:MAG: hypothetical protein KC800_20100 [Candidatus Eremiobacteraeota bacterium]|nr:hypothetical protein [Candidatus Eremiobacteraeota bacterium]
MVDLRGDDDEDSFRPNEMRDLAVSMGVDRSGSTSDETRTFRESSLDSFGEVDADEDGFLSDSEYRNAMGNEASAEDAAAAIVGLEGSEAIQGYSNDEWFRENDGPTEADLEASGEAEEVRFQQELSRQALRDGHQFADDVPHGYDSVYGAEPTESQKEQIGRRGVTTAELELAYRSEDEEAAGLTVVDRARVVDGEAQPGMDRLIVVSAPLDAEGRVTTDDAISDGLLGEGTEHDDIVRIARAYDTGGPGVAERANKIIKGEPVGYVGPRSTYQVNSDINADQDQHGAPQFTEEGPYRGEATPLGSDISLTLGGGNNTVYIDQPINITGQAVEHLTTIEGSPNGMDTYNFDEGLMTREKIPVDVIYNGQSLFSFWGDQVESLDAIDISQAEGGTSRFRIPTNRLPALNEEHPLVQSGRLVYEGEYLVIR